LHQKDFLVVLTWPSTLTADEMDAGCSVSRHSDRHD